MVFAPNPLFLSVPDPAFESWLRDSGYLEVLDDSRPSASSPSAPAACPPSTSSSSAASSRKAPNSSADSSSFFSSLFSVLKTLAALITINPFAKLSPAEDLASPTPSWTLAFLGNAPSSFSWPAGPAQARMRVHENVRRYARNYACLALVFLACSLYQMPVPLLGVVSSLLLWEGVRFCSERWGLEEKHPTARQVLVRIAQFATAVILYSCNLQLAFFCALSISYAVMILHASLRKLAPPKHPVGLTRHRR